MNELRIGASMIKEAIAREAKRQEDEELKNAREATELAAHMEKVRMHDSAIDIDVSGRQLTTRFVDSLAVHGRPPVCCCTRTARATF